ncbi:L-rhamnose mutarotase [Dysgonomonas sp. 511]|uniref:L-rhamnose mutarotase n=1 Tax=Dysgonomonas sp. 511 TaxID=2302930 RepID=UPI0013D46860|nr:L-rhamnose mutarotase [Dysgonomonas sp. 511]NDV79715.1 L-rhamnose mutarotase [Dysgonomonas sp. 511]
MKYKILYILLAVSLLFAACSQQKKPSVNGAGATKDGVPSIIEVASKTDSISPGKFLEVCKKYNINQASVYQWKNRLIVFDVFDDYQVLMHELTLAYADEMLEVKYYDEPYYIFNRKNCDNKETAAEWSHTIMTASLVADTTMQREYMEYHATQSEMWPEVANGFCNADFQQLLMYRNGRQLMLIISIPKGENLDELNPKTTENNPRVDEWNAIMAKYQEGIQGTQPGESWVVFSAVN